ncbi:hypothetical protein [Burkholderia cenocepacia]|uniref:hypothetical protein n=1 Tax=Burkholderia cenocepacia TaxID=95486 RepID=UPI002AB79E96|nr:hypothetical protein [Burkholderia cenocepacia]
MAPTPLGPLDVPRILAAMTPGKSYLAAVLARRLGLGVKVLRPLLERLVTSGELERGLFRNADGTDQTRYYLAGETTPLQQYDSIRRVAEIRGKDMLDAMKPGVGYRAEQVAAQFNIPRRRAVVLLMALVREGSLVKGTEANYIPRDHYFLVGTEPGAAPRSMSDTVVGAPRTPRPAFDAEYARSLESFRAVCEASRLRT